MDELTHEMAVKIAGALPFSELLDKVRAEPDFARALNITKIGNPITVTAVPSADKMVDKLIRNASRAGGDWLEGMQNPDDDPKEAAKRAAGKYQSNMDKALKEKRWEKGIDGRNLDEELATAAAVGQRNFEGSFDARKAKIGRKFAQLQPMIVAVKAKIRAMKQDTDADREQRAVEAIRGMREIGRKLKGV